MTQMPPIPNHVAIVETDRTLVSPYKLFMAAKKLSRYSDLQTALKELSDKPDLVLLSTSLPIQDQVRVLERVKQLSTDHLIPVMFVINFLTPISVVPGTDWGRKIGVIHALSSTDEIYATLCRVLE